MVQCYYKNDDNPNLIRSINSGVCMGSGSSAGFFSCCFPWDQCLPNGICHANSSSTYYTALCTDQTLGDSSCQKGCAGLYRTGLEYNTTVDLWACCDASDPTCSTSTNATFEAPAPESLLQQTMTIVDFIPTATSSATTASGSTTTATGSTTAATGPTTTASSIASSIASSSSTSATLSSSTSAAANSQQDSSSTIGPGAIAGICIGVLVLIAVIAGLSFWLLKRRKQSRQMSSSTPVEKPVTQKEPFYGEMPAQKPYGYGSSELSASVAVEAPGTPGLHSGRGKLHELT